MPSKFSRMTNRMGRGFAWLGLAVCLTSAASAGPRVTLDKVSIHLFLEKSGEFSPDVTSMSGLVVHNFVPFGDDFPDGEKIHAFLIKVWFRADGEAFASGRQARVIVREEKSGRKVLERVISSVYVGSNGLSAHAILISGHECAPLIIEVQSGTKSIKNRLPFRCAE